MTDSTIAVLSAEIARAALTGLVDQMPAAKNKGKKHRMSPEGRARIEAAVNAGQ